jgi:peptide deformylase
MLAVPETRFDTVRGNFANIGVRQYGHPVLRRVCKPVSLPGEEALVTQVFECLSETINAARGLHDFSRGIGLAAPQIGIPRRIAIVHPVGRLPIRLINPRVLRESADVDTQFEGCLSFFDYRGEVARSRQVTIAFDDIRGEAKSLDLADNAARLALHEIDHLDGRLFIDRMEPGAQLIVDEGQHP